MNRQEKALVIESLFMKKIQCSVHHKCQRNFEEDFALRAVLALCRLHKVFPSKIECEPLGQSKPPDYGFYIKNKKVALEVILSSDGFMADKSGRVCRVSEVLTALFRKLNDLEPKINKWISSEGAIDLFLKVSGKINKKIFRRLVDELNEELRRRYENGDLSSNDTNIKLEDAPEIEISAKLVQRRNGKASTVQVMPDGTSRVPLREKARLALRLCINSKNTKMKDLPFDDKWLVIVNRHPLLDIDAYVEAYKTIENEGELFCFSKIFIVDNRGVNGVVYDFNSKSSTIFWPLSYPPIWLARFLGSLYA